MKVSHAVVDNLDLLHTLDETRGQSAAEVARQLGRDKSNVGKSLAKLREAGLVGAGADLTEDGRRLTRLVAADGELTAPADVVMLRFDQVILDPDNERAEYDAEALAKLRASIVARGLLQPIVVTPPETDAEPYRLLIGERRLRAIDDAVAADEWASDRLIPARVSPPLDALERAYVRLTENLQREDLHPLDEGAGYQRLRDRHGVSTAEIAEQVGRTQKHVQDRIALVERLSETDKARMRLPDEHPDHLGYKAAREQMREHRPKPVIELSDREAMAILEIEKRAATRPSRHPQFVAGDGWTEIAALPTGGTAQSLVERGLIQIAEPDFGSGAFVRACYERSDLHAWRQTLMGATFDGILHQARAKVVTPLQAAEIDRSGRYATDWLNMPEPVEPPLPAPIAAALADVCRAIALFPKTGPRGAYTGASAYDYFKYGAAQALLTARMVKFQPDGAGGWLVCLTERGEAWRDENAEAITLETVNVVAPAFATEWLNPPPPDLRSPAQPKGKTPFGFGDEARLSPQNALVLTELAHKADALGRRSVPVHNAASRSPAISRLFMAGLISEGSSPEIGHTIGVGDTAREWLRSEGLDPRESPSALADARRRFGLADAAIAELEASGRYQTPWLNAGWEPEPEPVAAAPRAAGGMFDDDFGRQIREAAGDGGDEPADLHPDLSLDGQLAWIADAIRTVQGGRNFVAASEAILSALRDSLEALRTAQADAEAA